MSTGLAVAPSSQRALEDTTERVWPVLGVGVLGAVIAVFAALSVPMPIDSDLGLWGVLPIWFWCGVGLVSAALSWHLYAGPLPRPGIAAALLGLLIGILYGAPAIIQGSPRTEVAWRHLGISDAIIGSGQIDTRIDAYFGWPGFFAGMGAVVQASGLRPEWVALAAPVVNGCLWALGVYVLVRTLTSEPRWQWLSVWVFVLANWIDQDYWSPQAFTFFLYLVATSLVLGPLSVLRGQPQEPRTARRIAALLAVVLIYLTIVVSHQLTPVFVLLGLGVLTLVRRLWTPGLVIIVVVMVVAWLGLGAADYLASHPVLFQTSPGGSAAANLTERDRGSSGHRAIVLVRTAFTCGAFVIGAWATWLLYRRGRLDVRVPALAAAPLVGPFVQSYGGEMVLRATLFATPFVAVLAASLVADWTPRRHSRARRVAMAAAVAGMATCLAMVMMISRMGNARFDMFTASEIAGAEQFDVVSKPGEVGIAGAHPTPWRQHDYAEVRTRTVTELCVLRDPLRECRDRLLAFVHDNGGRGSIMFTRANRESIRMQGEAPGDPLTELTVLLREAGARLVYGTRDVIILRVGDG